MQEPSATSAAWVEARMSLLRRLAAAFFLLLLAVTWPLWTPEHAFPQAPMFLWLGRLPDGAQWAAAAGLVASLLATLVIPGRFRRAPDWATLAAVACAAALMAFDQHRWQAWTYHLTLCLAAIALLPAASALVGLRWLTISIYAYSAWSKVDLTFLETLGSEFVVTFARLSHIGTSGWRPEFKATLATVFPAGELLVAIALAWPRARGVGLMAAISSHAALLLLLGPWGLNHRWGVLLWNAYFIVQDPLLMAPPLRWELARARPAPSQAAPPPLAGQAASVSATEDERAAPSEVSPRLGVGELTGRAMIALAMLAPLGEPWGWCDHWMAWSLYSPRVERVDIRLIDTSLGECPAPLRAFVAEDQLDLRLRADLWSLAVSRAPQVPQCRFQLAVALWVADQLPPGGDIRAIKYGVADRWTGKRETLTLDRWQLSDAADAYWLNARPREPRRPTSRNAEATKWSE